MNRRHFMRGILAAATAPYVITAADVLMPVRSLVLPPVRSLVLPSGVFSLDVGPMLDEFTDALLKDMRFPYFIISGKHWESGLAMVVSNSVGNRLTDKIILARSTYCYERT